METNRRTTNELQKQPTTGKMKNKQRRKKDGNWKKGVNTLLKFDLPNVLHGVRSVSRRFLVYFLANRCSGWQLFALAEKQAKTKQNELIKNTTNL